jgi:hypothetical protein
MVAAAATRKGCYVWTPKTPCIIRLDLNNPKAARRIKAK